MPDGLRAAETAFVYLCLSKIATVDTTPEDMDYIFRGERWGQPYALSRQWVTWHVIEHDLHHGGELSFSLGANGLAAPDL